MQSWNWRYIKIYQLLTWRDNGFYVEAGCYLVVQATEVDNQDNQENHTKKYYFHTHHDLPFKSVHPVLSLISIITTRYFNIGTVCLGVYVQTGATSVICCRLLILYQEYFYSTRNIIPNRKQKLKKKPTIPLSKWLLFKQICNKKDRGFGTCRNWLLIVIIWWRTIYWWRHNFIAFWYQRSLHYLKYSSPKKSSWKHVCLGGSKWFEITEFAYHLRRFSAKELFPVIVSRILAAT